MSPKQAPGAAWLHGYMLGATVLFGFGEQFFIDTIVEGYLEALERERLLADARGRFTMDAEGVRLLPPDNQQGGESV